MPPARGIPRRWKNGSSTWEELGSDADARCSATSLRHDGRCKIVVVAPIHPIRQLHGNEFQRFCSVLLTAADQEFQAVRGEGGDLGADGFAAGKTIVFQVYGPEHFLAHKVRSKIDESLLKATDLRARQLPALKIVRFLTPVDLTVEQHLYLDREARRHAFDAETWGESKLLGLLASHPEIATVFPEFLMPSILDAIRALQTTVDQAVARNTWNELVAWNDVDELGRSATFPDLYVMARDEASPFAEHRAYEYWRAWVHSPSLASPSLEPVDEDQFRDAIRARFIEDCERADIEDRTDSHVLVGHAGDAYRFHRRWARWTHGTIGMVASIRESRASRTGQYSLADIAIDFDRFLQLCGDLIPERGPVHIRFGFTPGTLALLLDAADERVADRLNARLMGVTNVLRTKFNEQPSERVYDELTTTDNLIARAHELTAELLAPQLKHFHKARVDTRALAESIPVLLTAAIKVRAL